MRFLSLDPSSRCVGWALFDGGALARCGVIRAKASLSAWDRAERLAIATGDLALSARPDRIVMEVVSGMHRRARPVAVAATAHAQGALRFALRAGPVAWPVDCVGENEWTGGTRKAVRALAVAGEPAYRPFAREDAGLDAADAIGLGRFWIERNGG